MISRSIDDVWPHRLPETMHRRRALRLAWMVTLPVSVALLAPLTAYAGPPPELYSALDAHRCRPGMRPGADLAFRAVFETVEDLLSQCNDRRECEGELAVALANVYLYLDYLAGDDDLSFPDGDPFPRASLLLQSYLRCTHQSATYRWDSVPCEEDEFDCSHAPKYALVKVGESSSPVLPPIAPLDIGLIAKRRSDPLAHGGYPLYGVFLPEDANRDLPTEVDPSPGKEFSVSRTYCLSLRDGGRPWDGVGTAEFWNAMIDERLREIREETKLPISAAEIISIITSLLLD